jgi:hypothetical protein
MNYKERKLKGLLIERTLDYIKNHEGKNNAKQVTALHSLRTLQRSFEYISMEKFVEDQKEFFKLKQANERMHERFRGHSHGDTMISCYPQQDLYHDMETVNESRVYLLIEILEGKHNEFLQSIIDRSKDK